MRGWGPVHEIRRSSVWTPQRSSYAGHLQVSRKEHLQLLLLFSAAPLQPSGEDIYSPQQFSSSLPLDSWIEIQILLASTFARHEILLGKMFSYPSRNNKGMCSLQTSNRSNSLNTAVAFSFIHCAIPVPNLGLGHLFFQE